MCIHKVFYGKYDRGMKQLCYFSEVVSAVCSGYSKSMLSHLLYKLLCRITIKMSDFEINISTFAIEANSLLMYHKSGIVYISMAITLIYQAKHRLNG